MDLVFSPTDGSEWTGVLEADGLRAWRGDAGMPGFPRHGWYVGAEAGVASFIAGPFPDPIGGAAREHLTDAVVDGEPWTGWEVSVHTPRPLTSDGVLIPEGCDLLGGTPCHYESDTAGAHRLMREIARTGDWSVIWPVLAGRYRREIAPRA
jgi:hypothetical protein